MKIHEHVLLVCLMKTVFQINNWITWLDDRAGSPVCIRKLPCGNLISVTEIDARNISFCLWRLKSLTIEVTALLALCWPVTCHLFTRSSSQNLSLRAMLARETYSLWNVSVKGLSNASLNLHKQIFLYYSSMHFCSVYKPTNQCVVWMTNGVVCVKEDMQNEASLGPCVTDIVPYSVWILSISVQ